jgi:hypothetical protein
MNSLSPGAEFPVHPAAESARRTAIRQKKDTGFIVNQIYGHTKIIKSAAAHHIDDINGCFLSKRVIFAEFMQI